MLRLSSSHLIRNNFPCHYLHFLYHYYKQLLDEVSVISGIIKVEVLKCYQPKPKAILTSLSANLTLLSVDLTLLLEIMHCARNLQITYRLVNNL